MDQSRAFGEGFLTGSDTEYYYVVGDAPTALSATALPRKGFAYARGEPGAGGAQIANSSERGAASCNTCLAI